MCLRIMVSNLEYCLSAIPRNKNDECKIGDAEDRVQNTLAGTVPPIYDIADNFIEIVHGRSI